MVKSSSSYELTWLRLTERHRKQQIKHVSQRTLEVNEDYFEDGGVKPQSRHANGLFSFFVKVLQEMTTKKMTLISREQHDKREKEKKSVGNISESVSSKTRSFNRLQSVRQQVSH